MSPQSTSIGIADMSTKSKKVIHKASAKLTPKADATPAKVVVDDTARLKEIRALVKANNRSSVDDNVIICQIYMESRFVRDPKTEGSSAKGLMQLLRAPIRELYRLQNLKRPRHDRLDEGAVFKDADKFHDSEKLLDEATNIQTGTEYLQLLIDRETAKGVDDPVAEAYKDYRGLRNGIYYRKIKAGADELAKQPDSMDALRSMVK